MGRQARQSRQSRRAQERRTQHARHHQPKSTGPNWSIIGGLGVVLAVVALFAVLYATQGTGLAGGAKPTPTEVPAAAVDGVGCNPGGEIVTYHHHAHLTILDNGKSVTVPALIGFNVDHDCLYWVHTHEPSEGIIHMEGPYKFVPQLGTFFKIWGEPLSNRQVGTIEVKPGQTIKAYVNGSLYTGNPNHIKLHPGTQVVLEIGPTFVPPPTFDFTKLGVNR